MRWAAHNVRFHQTGDKQLRHPVVGELELSYEVMELSADAGLTITVYTAEPGSPLRGGARPARQLGRDAAQRRRRPDRRHP